VTGLDVQRLADFCHDIRWDAIPSPVRSMARTLLVDTLGCLVGGLRYPQVQALAERLGADAVGAAPFGRLVTWGAAATWLDADSGGSFHPQGHRMPPVPTAHPAPHVLPVLLHHAAQESRSDVDLLEAFVAAMEVGLRFGVGTTLRPGFHPHGIHGPVAAAVAQSLLTGLDRQTTAHAILLGLSQPLSATLTVPMRGGTVRNIWTGLGTFLGAQSAVRASGGAVGDVDVARRLFDGAVATDLDLEEIQGDLGTRWRMLDSYLKPYACARRIHPMLDAFGEAVNSSGRELGPGLAAEIVGVDVTTFAFAASLSAREVDSDMHARFSLPTCVSALAVHGRLVADNFLPAKLADTRVAATASMVNLSEHADFTAALPFERPASVTIRWRDGSTSSATVRNARGNPDHPLSVDEVLRKFEGNAGATVDPQIAASLVRGGGSEDDSTADLAAVARRLVEEGPSGLG